ncbi:peroxisome membrane protein [Collybia nuda]|uniref:Peroxisomal membrane protein PEX16 n=1 Tax=Collybia nuda TaxID=64659 RepID=A0A9P5XWM3_9AGAR|nr:peroxisome membrane protein [Collybia nuda]
MSASIARYESFLINNVSTISSLESSLRSVTWFLPGRFKDAELASEALSALLNVMSMYHDTLLTRVARSDQSYHPLIPPSPHTRFTKMWSEKNSSYKWAARMLQFIRYTELVIEMVLRRKVPSKSRWRGVVLLEVIKASFRFLLLHLTHRPLLSPPIPERDFDPASIPPASNVSSPTLAPSSPLSSLPVTPEHLKNNHSPLPPHSLLINPPPIRADSTVSDYLFSKAMTTSSVKPPPSLVQPLLSPQDWLAEILYIIKPLVYASMLVYNRRSNSPLITALTLELVSRNLRRNPPPSSLLERSEYARRDKNMLWYLLRGSIWEYYTRPKLESLVEQTSHAPLLGLLSGFIHDWIPLIDEYYYYTAP